MKRWYWTATLLLYLVAGDAEATQLKIGGGLVLDPTAWGGHISVDIPLGSSYPTYLAPYADLYRDGGSNLIPLGVALLYKAPLTDLFGTVYFGAGGGILRFTQATALGVLEDAFDPMVSAGGGIHLDFSEKTGVFIQARWFRRFESGARNEVSIHAGISFQLSEE